MNGIMSLIWRVVNALASHGKKHEHIYKLKYTMEDIWAECECGVQRDIPDELVQEAIGQIQSGNLDWSY